MGAPEKKGLRAGQTRALKLTLDAIMLILLVLMYRKQVISMEFHEIGGLALIGLFIVHHLVNMRWIGAATKTLFARGTSAMVRARYFVDVLLLLAFLAIGVTGVLINKTLFAIHVAGNAKALHYFASALAIIIMGVHLGLHADYIFGKLLKKGASKAIKIALAVVLAAMVGFGGYSLFRTQFVSFLSAPFSAGQSEHGAFAPDGDGTQGDFQGGRPGDASQQTGDASTQQTEGDTAMQPPEGDAGTQSVQGESNAQPPQGESGTQPPQSGESAGAASDDATGQFTPPSGAQGAREGHEEGGSTNAALLIAQYVSIITLFAAATVGVVKLTGKQKKHPGETAVVPAVIAEAEVEDLEE